MERDTILVDSVISTVFHHGMMSHKPATATSNKSTANERKLRRARSPEERDVEETNFPAGRALKQDR
jgi:hypothetical protein